MAQMRMAHIAELLPELLEQGSGSLPSFRCKNGRLADLDEIPIYIPRLRIVKDNDLQCNVPGARPVSCS